MGSPVCKEQTETDCFEDAGKSSHSYSVERTLLGEDLRDEAWGRASHEYQTTQVRGTLVAQGASSIDQGANTVRLNGATD